MAKQGPRKKLPKELAVITADNCTGCEACLEVCPVCPWDAIEMVPTEQVAQVVAQIGGPPDYVERNWDRLVGTAQHLAELKVQAG